MGTVLLDLSKAFDCIPYDLLAAILQAYGLSEDAVTYVDSYLKCRKQDVKIHDPESFSNTFISYAKRFYIRPHSIQYPYK